MIVPSLDTFVPGALFCLPSASQLTRSVAKKATRMRFSSRARFQLPELKARESCCTALPAGFALRPSSRAVWRRTFSSSCPAKELGPGGLDDDDEEEEEI